MSDDFFDRLDEELAGLTREGAHLTGDRADRRVRQLARRGVMFALLVMALAAAFVSEFPAVASGHAHVTPTLTADRL